jgi:hypothetical protein
MITDLSIADMDCPLFLCDPNGYRFVQQGKRREDGW